MTQLWELLKDISNETGMNIHLNAGLIYVLESSQHYSVKRVSSHWRGNVSNHVGRSASLTLLDDPLRDLSFL